MRRATHLPGAVLPTVLVVSVLLALGTGAVISLWDADFLHFSRRMHEEAVRAHIESGFTLYAEYPDEVLSRLDADGAMTLYDSVPHSRIAVSRRRHGLYEVVTVRGHGGRCASKIFGLREPGPDDCVLYSPDRGSSITMTGKTHLRGRVCVPAVGVVYGQRGSDFFNGKEIPAAMMTPSGSELPFPCAEALATVEESMALAVEDVVIDGSMSLSDTVIVARKARIERGFSGSLQIFASDSITVAEGVALEYPSGLFSERHVSVADGSVVNGYVIVLPSDGADVMSANYKQSRRATVRGLVYVDGTAQIQGVVSGVAMVDRAVYYSPGGYYENMLYDVTVLENREMAWPMWLDGADGRRKEIKWID